MKLPGMLNGLGAPKQSQSNAQPKFAAAQPESVLNKHNPLTGPKQDEVKFGCSSC